MPRPLSRRRAVIVGYARVSTGAQALGALAAAGAGRVFRENVSGARRDRPELRRLLEGLGRGDVVLVTRRDRPARSTHDPLEVLATGTERRGWRCHVDRPSAGAVRHRP